MSGKNLVEILDDDGQVRRFELVRELSSKKDDRVYLILTDDKEIKEEVTIHIGSLLKDGENSHFELVTDEDEIKYVYGLMEEDIRAGE